ncbi:MAG TPA: HIT family protein [Acidobacteriota bacterium]|nr:HIT family protein [Acidobacteriota bacterium]HQG92969.1 HIT family protein [Acidobacteriota bacterium]HQK88559.1 HIT family protein [Acidobacteriota bacterium]
MICPFCSPEPTRILAENSHALALFDNFPVSPGHALIVPRRHVASLFETSEAERQAMWELLDETRRILVEKHKPDGFNIGVNDGAAAGQTVMHLHVHLIPRYAGDAAEPRGGVRRIFPDKAAYWEER